MRKIIFAVLAAMLIFTACEKENSEEIEKLIDERIEERLNEHKEDEVGKGDNKSIIIYKAEKENPTKAEMKKVAALLRTRLDDMGYTESDVSVEKDGIIEVEIEHTNDIENIVASIGAVAQLKFYDNSAIDPTTGQFAEGAKEILNGTHIKDATPEYGNIDDSGDKNYYIQLEFTEEGRKAFYDATSRNIGQPIYISVDGNVITAPVVQQAIDDTSCIITGDFTKEAAKNLAANIKSGQLPFSLKVVEIQSGGK